MPVVLASDMKHTKCKSITLRAHREANMHTHHRRPHTTLPFKPFCIVKTWYHNNKRNLNTISTEDLAECMLKSLLLFAQLTLSSCQGMTVREWAGERDRGRRRTKPFFFPTQKLHPSIPIFQLRFSIFLLCSSRYSPLICTWLNEQLNSKALLCRAESKRQDRKERWRMKMREKVVYAEHLTKVCLVNRLIPSPPKSNH